MLNLLFLNFFSKIVLIFSSSFYCHFNFVNFFDSLDSYLIIKFVSNIILFKANSFLIDKFIAAKI